MSWISFVVLPPFLLELGLCAGELCGDGLGECDGELDGDPKISGAFILTGNHFCWTGIGILLVFGRFKLESYLLRTKSSSLGYGGRFTMRKKECLLVFMKLKAKFLWIIDYRRKPLLGAPQDWEGTLHTPSLYNSRLIY